MSSCWANCLGDCREHITKEHLISKSLFPNSTKIFVKGFSWCVNEPKEVGLASLTSHILCKHHNNNLSELDTAAGHAFNNFKAISKYVFEANENNGRFKIKDSHVNALLLERWLLKTLINICYKKDYLIGDSKVIGIPDDHLVKICFGKGQFLNGAGMYIASEVGEKMEFGSHLHIIPIVEDSEKRVVASMFKFAGLLMFLWLNPEKLPNSFDWIKHGIAEWENVRPSRPFKKIKFRIPNGHSHTLYFHW